MENNFEDITGDEILKGTPVSVGRIVARVCVVPDLEDARHIKVRFLFNYIFNTILISI